MWIDGSLQSHHGADVRRVAKVTISPTKAQEDATVPVMYKLMLKEDMCTKSPVMLWLRPCSYILKWRGSTNNNEVRHQTHRLCLCTMLTDSMPSMGMIRLNLKGEEQKFPMLAMMYLTKSAILHGSHVSQEFSVCCTGSVSENKARVIFRGMFFFSNQYRRRPQQQIQQKTQEVRKLHAYLCFSRHFPETSGCCASHGTVESTMLK